jgi:hypothetical protein
MKRASAAADAPAVGVRRSPLILVREHPLVPGDQLPFLDRIEILALEVLLGADQQHLLVADCPHHHQPAVTQSALVDFSLLQH